MACKYLVEFEKGQILASNDCELLLWDFAKKLNRYINELMFFLRISKKNWKLSRKRESWSNEYNDVILLTRHKLHQLSSIVLLKKFMPGLSFCFFSLCPRLFFSKMLWKAKSK